MRLLSCFLRMREGQQYGDADEVKYCERLQVSSFSFSFSCDKGSLPSVCNVNVSVSW